MKRRGHKTRIYILIILLIIVISMQLPFCKISQIGTTYVDTTLYESILRFKARIPLYAKTLFLTKGKTYHDILFSNQKQYDIKFGWDNSITLSSGNEQYRFNIDSVHIAEGTFSKTAEEMFAHIKSDSVYTCIWFYDGNNYLTLFRQKKSMKFKGKREGFEICINEKWYTTGKTSYFDY